MTSERRLPEPPPRDLFGRPRAWRVAFAAAIAVAVISRVVGIGQWSFASDELGTFHDVRMFLGDEEYAHDDPDRNVPKMVPVAMALHAASHAVFGTGEAGSRALPAVCGVLQVVLVGLGLKYLLGRTPAFATAALLAVSPEHLFYAQYHRFYAPAALFATLAFLAAARSLGLNSARRMVWACAAAMLAVLTHTLVGMIFGGFVVAAALARAMPDGARSNRLLLAAAGGAVFAALFAALYLYPLAKGKAVGYGWEGYSISHAVFSGVSQVTWPVAVFSVPGLVILWKRDRVQAAFWGSQAAVWAASLLVLPKMLPFHSAYVFPLCLPVIVLGGVAVGEIADRLTPVSKLAGLTGLAGLLMLNLPAVVSHYQDGSRHDFRAAANWVGDRIGPTDVMVVVQGDKLSHYRPELEGRWHRLPYKDIPKFVDDRRPADGQVWVVLPGGRGGLPEPWREWAEKNARWRATIVHRRFDYHEYPIYILAEDRPGR